MALRPVALAVLVAMLSAAAIEATPPHSGSAPAVGGTEGAPAGQGDSAPVLQASAASVLQVSAAPPGHAPVAPAPALAPSGFPSVCHFDADCGESGYCTFPSGSQGVCAPLN